MIKETVITLAHAFDSAAFNSRAHVITRLQWIRLHTGPRGPGPDTR